MLNGEGRLGTFVPEEVQPKCIKRVRCRNGKSGADRYEPKSADGVSRGCTEEMHRKQLWSDTCSNRQGGQV